MKLKVWKKRNPKSNEKWRESYRTIRFTITIIDIFGHLTQMNTFK